MPDQTQLSREQIKAELAALPSYDEIYQQLLSALSSCHDLQEEISKIFMECTELDHEYMQQVSELDAKLVAANTRYAEARRQEKLRFELEEQLDAVHEAQLLDLDGADLPAGP